MLIIILLLNLYSPSSSSAITIARNSVMKGTVKKSKSNSNGAIPTAPMRSSLTTPTTGNYHAVTGVSMISEHHYRSRQALSWMGGDRNQVVSGL